jgi:hypothetical protein
MPQEILPQNALSLIIDSYKKSVTEDNITPTEKDLEGVTNYILTCFYDISHMGEHNAIQMELRGKQTRKCRFAGNLIDLGDKVKLEMNGESYTMQKSLLQQCKPNAKVDFSEVKIDKDTILYLRAYKTTPRAGKLLDAMHGFTVKDRDVTLAWSSER